MELNELSNYCLSKKSTYEDHPFGIHPLVIKVCDKIFAIINTGSVPLTISLKCDPLLAESLRQQYESVRPGYHLNKQHWNTVTLCNNVPDDELRWMIDHSYYCVIKKLSKSQRDELL